jgi:hypothetical protein
MSEPIGTQRALDQDQEPEPESVQESPESSVEPTVQESAPPTGPVSATVLTPEAAENFRTRWSGIQAGFVDDPHHAVQDADRFVADIARAFNSGLEDRRRTLATVWDGDGHGETEELRMTMRKYRALVDRMLIG